MKKLSRVIVFILLIIGIEKYGFGLGYEGKAAEVKLPAADQINNNSTANIAKTSSGYLSSFLSSSSKTKTASISPRDQQAAIALDAIDPNENKLEGTDQAHQFLTLKNSQQIQFLKTKDAVLKKEILTTPQSAQWSFSSLFKPSLKTELNKVKISDSETASQADTASVNSDVSYQDEMNFNQLPEKSNPSQISTERSNPIVTSLPKTPVIEKETLTADQPNNINQTNITQKKPFFSFNPFKKISKNTHKATQVNESATVVDTSVPAAKPAIKVTTQKYKVGEGMMNLPGNESIIEIQPKSNTNVVEKNPENMTPKELAIYEYKQYKAEQSAAKKLVSQNNSQIPTSQQNL